ncbi:MAG: hypothetical protein ACFB00_10905 [Parvularculaceae bacterium]
MSASKTSNAAPAARASGKAALLAVGLVLGAMAIGAVVAGEPADGDPCEELKKARFADCCAPRLAVF